MYPKKFTWGEYLKPFLTLGFNFGGLALSVSKQMSVSIPKTF
jgi:hypothetical protein